MIELVKPRIDISSLFISYLEELSKPKYTYYGGYYDDWYGDEWDDWYGDGCGYDSFFHGMGGYSNVNQKKKVTVGDIVTTKKSKKRGKRGKGKKGKCIPLYNYENDNLYDSDEVTIYFYRDINNPDDKEIFYNLYEFNEFLDSEGIYVSKYETKQLMNNSISHCCVDPSFADLKGEPWLISDSSYGGLSWAVSGDNDDLLFKESMMYNNNNGDDLPY